MSEKPMGTGTENEDDESVNISMSRLSYNKETGEVKRDLFWDKMAAESGDLDAMCTLGSAYLIGTDVDQNPMRAAELFEKAAAGGVSVAMFNLALMYAKGFGVERDFAQAAEWMRKARDAGDEDAERIAPRFEEDAETAAQAEAGDTEAQARFSALLQNIGSSNMLKEAGAEQDYSDSLYWAWKAAKAGEPIAMNCLGVLYSTGQGTMRNYEEAFRWYLKAAEQGLNIAMANVAYYYVYGKAGVLDPEKAVEWFEKAIAAGWEDSNGDLQRTRKIAETLQAARTGGAETWADAADELRGVGLSLESTGNDPQLAYRESLAWAEKAAEANQPKGLRVLAMALLFGRGVEKDPERAVALLQQGCEMDDADCMVTLGQAFLNGDGVERDTDRARELLTKARDLDNETAAELLGKLSGERITEEELGNLAVRAAILGLLSGKSPEEVAESFGLNKPIVELINVVRLLRGVKRPEEDLDSAVDMSTKLSISLILSKLEKGESPEQIAGEFPLPLNLIQMIDQVDTFFRKK